LWVVCWGLVKIVFFFPPVVVKKIAGGGGRTATNKRAQLLPTALPNQNTDTSHVLRSVARTCVDCVWDLYKKKKMWRGSIFYVGGFFQGGRAVGRVEIEGVRTVLKGIFPLRLPLS